MNAPPWVASPLLRFPPTSCTPPPSQMTITLTITIWQYKNTSTTKTNGGSIQISKVPILCQWRTDLTSNRHCLPGNNWNGKKELTEINNGHRVLLLLHGGIGKFHGGLLILMKVTMEMNQVLTERCDLLNSIWNNSSGQEFLEFNYLLQMDRLQLTAVCCYRRCV